MGLNSDKTSKKICINSVDKVKLWTNPIHHNDVAHIVLTAAYSA